jgi:hypothetical protein
VLENSDTKIIGVKTTYTGTKTKLVGFRSFDTDTENGNLGVSDKSRFQYLCFEYRDRGIFFSGTKYSDPKLICIPGTENRFRFLEFCEISADINNSKDNHSPFWNRSRNIDV